MVAKPKYVTLSLNLGPCSHFIQQLCVILHVRMVLVFQMTLATVLLDMKEKDVLTEVSLPD